MEKVFNLVFLLLCFWITSASANSLVSRYNVYIGDVDGDGLDDFYFHETPRIILLYGDIIIPIGILDDISYVVFGTTVGFEDAVPLVISRQDLEAKLSSSQLVIATKGFDYELWKNEESSDMHILLRGLTSGASSVVLLQKPGFNYPSTERIIEADVAADLSDRSSSVILDDVNYDGRKDISLGGYVYLADFAGIPSSGLASLTIPSLIVETFSYDDLGRLKSIQSNTGLRIDYQLDDEDNRSTVSKVKSLNN